MRIRSARVLLIYAWLGAGCFESGDGGAAGEGGSGDPAGATALALVGDWIQCRDAACESFDGDGTRFTEDGSLFELDIDEGPVGDGPVCLDVRDLVGHYSFADGVLMLDDGPEFEVEIRGDRLTLHEVGGPERAVMQRIRAQAMEACPDESPPVASGF